MKPQHIQVAAYLPRSRANGPGLRSVLWVQGCPLRCVGCFNPDLLCFEGGHSEAVAAVADRMLSDAETEGVSFSGGEPFAQAAPLAELAERIRAAGKGVLIFTGCTAAVLAARTDAGTRRLLAAADLLVAGPYRRELPSRHPLLASANQELVFLTERYRDADLGPRRSEIRIGAGGELTLTGFPRNACAVPRPASLRPVQSRMGGRPHPRSQGSAGDTSAPCAASNAMPDSPSPLVGEGAGGRGGGPAECVGGEQ